MSRLTHLPPLSTRQEQTLHRLLDAAETHFLEAGYAGTTLAAVAGRAQVSTATLHKYFPTKRALFGGVMERFWSTGNHLPSVDADPAASLRRIGRAYAELLSPPTTPALFRVVIAETIQHPELGQELYDRGKRPYLTAVEAAVNAAVERGALHVDDVALAVRQFLGMINDIVFWPRLLVADLQLSQAEIQTVVDEATTTFMARYGLAGSR